MDIKNFGKMPTELMEPILVTVHSMIDKGYEILEIIFEDTDYTMRYHTLIGEMTLKIPYSLYTESTNELESE